MFLTPILILCLFGNVFSIPAFSHLLITRVGSCTDQKMVPIMVSEMSIHKVAYDASLSGLINVTADVENGWTVLVTMQKCHDIRNLDTCDYYKTLTLIKNGCQESEDADIYRVFFQFVTPKMECPLKAGSYKISDFPFFTESNLAAVESKISTSVFGYTYRMEAFDGDYDKLLCVEAHLRMFYVRKHDWLGDKKDRGFSTTKRPTTKPDKDLDTDDKGNNDDDVVGADDVDNGGDGVTNGDDVGINKADDNAGNGGDNVAKGDGKGNVGDDIWGGADGFGVNKEVEGAGVGRVNDGDDDGVAVNKENDGDVGNGDEPSSPTPVEDGEGNSDNDTGDSKTDKGGGGD